MRQKATMGQDDFEVCEEIPPFYPVFTSVLRHFEAFI